MDILSDRLSIFLNGECSTAISYLDHKTFAGIVVGLALAAPAELDLEPLEVSLVFDDFNVDLKRRYEIRVKWYCFFVISAAKGQILLVTAIQRVRTGSELTILKRSA